MHDLLCEGLGMLGLPGNSEVCATLEAYISEIQLWNTRVDLVRVRHPEDLVVRHILDSVVAAPRLQTIGPVEWADFGSGAGLPGIPLAIVLPQMRFSLVERSGRRAAFLRGTIALLGLKDRVSVIEEDVSRLSTRYGGVVFRAFRPFTSEVVESLSRAMIPGAVLVAFKGRAQAIVGELDQLKNGFSAPVIERVTVPFLEEERHLVIAERL